MANRVTGRWSTFLLAQIVLLAGIVSAGVWRSRQLLEMRTLPPLLERPRRVEPLHDYPVVVTDEQLTRVLQKLRPRDLGAETKINHTDHALRFWGAQAEFDDSRWMNGPEMIRRLTDHRRFQEVYGKEALPLLVDVDPGVRVRVQQGPTTSSHVDHTLACLAEVGVPLDFPLHTPQRQAEYRDMLVQSLRDFSLNQVEYEWSALAYVLFLDLPADRPYWVTSEGQRLDFNILADRIMRQEMPQGVCFGNHRLHALVMLLRVNEETPILEPATVAEIEAYLNQMTARLVQHQHEDGYWAADWPNASPTGAAGARLQGAQLRDAVLETGHALEWWALSRERLHPPRHVLARAGQWLVRTIDEMSDDIVAENYTYLTHAGRALALWRGASQAEFWHP